MFEYHFTLEGHKFKAEILVRGDWFLHEFASVLLKAMGFDDEPIGVEFCDHLSKPELAEECYSLEQNRAVQQDFFSESTIKWHSLLHTKVSSTFWTGRSLLCHFYRQKNWRFLVTCTAIKETAAKRRALTIVSRQGLSPKPAPKKKAAPKPASDALVKLSPLMRRLQKAFAQQVPAKVVPFESGLDPKQPRPPTEHHLTLLFQHFKAHLIASGSSTLEQLAEALLRALGFECDHAYEFCDNLKNPYRSQERYSLFADEGEESFDDVPDPGVAKTPVAAVFRAKRKMLFHFDYGDDWCFLVTCTAVKPAESAKPLITLISTSGTPPEQYPDNDEDWEDEDPSKN